MYKITVKGLVKDYDPNYIFEILAASCHDNFVEYFDGELEKLAAKKSITDGYMEFKMINGLLHTVTTYNSEQELTQAELELLKDYTEGQWSDGIGEGFEQEPIAYDEEDNEIYVSPWHYGQEVTIEQIEI